MSADPLFDTISDAVVALEGYDREDANELAGELLARIAATGRLLPEGTWSLPPEPGPEVTAVRCQCCKLRWERISAADPTERDGWGHGELDFDAEPVGSSWPTLVYYHSEPEFPLTDASTESP